MENIECPLCALAELVKDKKISAIFETERLIATIWQREGMKIVIFPKVHGDFAKIDLDPLYWKEYKELLQKVRDWLKTEQRSIVIDADDDGDPISRHGCVLVIPKF